MPILIITSRGQLRAFTAFWLKPRAATGLKTITCRYDMLCRLDTSTNGQLSKNELGRGLKELGVALSSHELDLLMLVSLQRLPFLSRIAAYSSMTGPMAFCNRPWIAMDPARLTSKSFMLS